MTQPEVSPEMIAKVAKQMSDLLLRFPAAATGGVRWQVLLSKYNERHGGSVDLLELGYSTPMDAAASLLWDVVRFIDTSNVEDPLIGVEDCIAISAEPRTAASWPFLYCLLCGIVRNHGIMEEAASSDGEVFAILVSQLKPKLQNDWHSDFDESHLSYYTEQGKLVRVKKMKHLLLALLAWHEDYRLRSTSRRHSRVDPALTPALELLPSKTHHDLLLRCAFPCDKREMNAAECQDPDILQDSPVGVSCMDEGEVTQTGHMPNSEVALDASSAKHMTNVWDNPSEPPPFEYCGNVDMTVVGVVSQLDGHAKCYETCSSIDYKSGSPGTAPTVWVWDGERGRILPVWCVMGDHSAHNFASAPVRKAVAAFESHKVLPSFFTMGSRQF